MEPTLPILQSFFPFWAELSAEHKDDLLRHSQPRRFERGKIIMPYQDECLGLMLVQRGQFRAFALSGTGKEVTLYRLYDLDICLFSASCVMNDIQFDIQIETEKDTDALLVPAPLYNRLLGQSIAMANYTNQLMASRFSDVMWVLEQVVFKGMGARVAQALLLHAQAGGSNTLSLTHDALARDLGTAREVVTRMLKYFRGEGALELTRGKIHLLDLPLLASIAES